MSLDDPQQLALLLNKLSLSVMSVGCYVAAMGLIYFDYLLMLPNEIKCIWKRERIDGATILLGIVRYATLLDATIRIVYLMSWAAQSEAEADLVCGVAWRIDAALSMISGLTIATLIALRMCALWQMNLWIFVIVLVLELLPTAIAFYESLTYTILAFPPPFRGCGEMLPQSGGTSTQGYHLIQISFGIGCEVVVLILTIYKTLETIEFLRKLPTPIHRTCSEMMLRDGTLYFMVLLVLRVTDMIVTLKSIQTFAVVTQAVRSILIGRMIFNLRGIFLTSHKIVSPGSSPLTPTIGSGIDFARNIFGNLAAPLSVSFDEDIEDEVDDGSIAPSIKPIEDCDSISEYSLKDNHSLSLSPTSFISKKALSILGDSEKGFVYYGDRHGIVVVDIRYGYI